MAEILSKIGEFFQTTGWKILIVIFTIVVGGLLISFLTWILRKILYKSTIDDAAVVFFSSLLSVVLWIVLVFILANLLDFSTNSILVAFSSVALAVGLALKDSLANLANGVLIIFNKPFKRGDLVNIGGIEARVQNIKLLTTEMITADNKKIVFPNNNIAINNIINYSSLPTRRIDYTFSVAYGSNMDLVEKVLLDLVKKQDKILSNPKPTACMVKHSSSSIDYCLKCWVATENYWDVYFNLPRLVYDAFETNKISIPFDQLDVHINHETTKTLEDKVRSLDKKRIITPKTKIVTEKIENKQDKKKA